MTAIDSLEQEAKSGGRVMTAISLKIAPERGKNSPPVRSKKKKKSTFSVSLERPFYVMIMSVCACVYKYCCLSFVTVSTYPPIVFQCYACVWV